MSIRILLADDHKIMRDGLRTLLQGQINMEVVGEAADGRTAVQLTAKLNPDVVVMDIGMPDLNGIEATRQILEEIPDVRIVALSMHSDKRFVGGMLKAGASGYLLKDCAFDELNRAINTIMTGQIYLSPGITGVVVEDYMKVVSRTDSSDSATLSPRERQVLQLLAEGKSTKEIAFDLSVSVKTIETHRQHIMEKLDLHSVAELTKYAVREGLTFLER